MAWCSRGRPWFDWPNALTRSQVRYCKRGNTESRLHAHAANDGLFGRVGLVGGDTSLRRGTTASHTLGGAKWKLNRRPKLCCVEKISHRHHVPSRARSRRNLLCAVCSVPSAPARRQHRSAVKLGHVVQDAISCIPATCCSRASTLTGSCSEVLDRGVSIH